MEPEAYRPIVTAALDGWTVDDHEGGEAPAWLQADPPDAPALPGQGWKLHVSASILNAAEVLAAAVRVLAEDPAAFKFSSNRTRLGRLNAGLDGASQVGKFITVYPQDDEQAVRLATALDDAAPQVTAPAVPTDRPLRDGSLVSYRYGAFARTRLQTALGQPVLALERPDGTLVADQRSRRYRKPDWVHDPFEAAGLGGATARQVVVDERFFLVQPLMDAVRGTVHVAVDLQQGRRVIVKQAAAGAAAGTDGTDAVERLQVETEVLRMLPPESTAPRLIASGTTAAGSYIAIEEIDGRPLYEHMLEHKFEGIRVPATTAHQIALHVARAIAVIHAEGWVYRDLKSANIIMSGGLDGTPRLIDFELSKRIGSVSFAGDGGSRGYRAPIFDGDPVSVADDVYALGALLWGLVTGVEPVLAPNELGLLTLPADVLNPAGDDELLALASACLQLDPAERPSSMDAVIEQLAAWKPRRRAAATASPTCRLDPLGLAAEVGRFLIEDAVEVEGGGTVWISRRRDQGGVVSRTLYEGTAGVALVLAELHEHGVVDAEAPLRGACEWLRDGNDGHEPQPGLLSGEMGAALALGRLGRLLGDDAAKATAVRIARSLQPTEDAGPDLTMGTAGLVRGLLLLGAELDEPLLAKQAVAFGEELLGAAEERQGGLAWPLPASLPNIGGQACYGYGHGAAGIADVLLDLDDATGDGRWADAAGSALDWVMTGAVGRGDALDWAQHDGLDPVGAHWCHGAAGISVALARAGREDEARRAAEMTARSPAWAASRCHGIAGNIETMLTVAARLGDDALAARAYDHGRLLSAWRLPATRWPGDSNDVSTADAMTGYGGVAPALLRLAGVSRGDGWFLPIVG